MAVTLSAAYLAELKKNINTPDIVLEVALDSGTVKWGLARGNGFSTVRPIIKSVSSLQNKIDTQKGYTTRGTLTVTIVGRDNFKTLIADNYLKNRRVTRKDGFIAAGFLYSDYAATFTGKILDWSRKGDELTLTIGDDMMVDCKKKLPVETAAKTQYLDYRNMNPVDIMQNILKTQLGISAALVDDAKFDSEQSMWLNSWVFDRVLTKPEEADKLLNELQQETNSFIIHDGEKITFCVFAPPMPGDYVAQWTDGFNIQSGSLSERSGYTDNFFNRVVVYYDYDESGDDKEDNYDTAVVAVDAASSGSGEWSEAKTKTIKSKWIRSVTHTQPSNITGAVLYHVSASNIAGSGTLTYNATNKTLQWTPPGGSIGAAVSVTKDGRYQLYGADTTKSVRVIVTYASLPGGNQTDAITVTGISGATYAAFLADKLLRRYRDPVATVSFDVDMNDVTSGTRFLRPTDIADVTTDEVCSKDSAAWSKERLMITSLRPDFSKGSVDIEAVQTKMYYKYGFIPPAGYPDYGAATDEQKRYCFIGRSSDNKVNAGTEPGFYIW